MSTYKDQLQYFLDFLKARREGSTWKYRWMTWVFADDLSCGDFFYENFKITFDSTTLRPVVDMSGFNQKECTPRMKHVVGALLHAVASLIARDDARMRVADWCSEDMENLLWIDQSVVNPYYDPEFPPDWSEFCDMYFMTRKEAERILRNWTRPTYRNVDEEWLMTTGLVRAHIGTFCDYNFKVMRVVDTLLPKPFEWPQKEECRCKRTKVSINYIVTHETAGDRHVLHTGSVRDFLQNVETAFKKEINGKAFALHVGDIVLIHSDKQEEEAEWDEVACILDEWIHSTQDMGDLTLVVAAT